MRFVFLTIVMIITTSVCCQHYREFEGVIKYQHKFLLQPLKWTLYKYLMLLAHQVSFIIRRVITNGFTFLTVIVT